jgi:preprotein translocase subunit SecG
LLLLKLNWGFVEKRMKRSFAILAFLMILTSMYANIFIDMYHKDYGIIDRSILVFSQKPNFKIIQNENDLQLNIIDCKKDINIQNTHFPNSSVIESFDYYSTEDKVMVIISLNRELQIAVGEKYKLEIEEIEDEVFRLILDIFATKNPATYEQNNSFAYFHDATGNPELAKPYRERAEKLKSEMLPEELAALDQTNNENPQGNITNTRKTIDGLAGFLTPSRIILIVIAILLIVAIIYTVTLLIKPKDIAPDFSESSLRLGNGFGTENFQREMIYKLEKNFWGVEEIAKELELHPSLVYRASAPDFADELEKS